MSAIIEELASEYVVTRRAKGAYANGRWATLPPNTLAIQAVVTPVAGTAREPLPQGVDLDTSLAVFTTAPLFAGGPQYDADVITIRDVPYQVKRVADYSEWGNFYHAFVERKDRP
jgi:hypothetical protein